MSDERRWHVEFRYADGVDHPAVDIEEISELQEIMEDGPDWGTLIDIVVTYNFKEAAADRGKTAKPS